MFVPTLATWLCASSLAFSASVVAGLLVPRAPRSLSWGPVHRIAVLIPGHKEGSVLVEAARSVLQDDYPRALVHVLVIADHCAPDVVEAVRGTGAEVLELALAPSTKVRSLRAALQALPPRWDTVVVLDADNLMERGFLRQIDVARQGGARAIQGWRAAKNRGTAMARLDGLMEDVHHIAFRAGQRALGLPAHLAGSGMAFDRGLLERALADTDPVGGFDKDLQATLCDQGVDVAWVPEAVVYDEKVEDRHALATQRRRWLSTQLTFLPRYAAVAWRGLRRGDLTGAALLGLALIPPRSLLLLGLVATLAMSLGTHDLVGTALAGTGLALLLLSLLAAAGPRRVAGALPAVPAALVAMVAAALRLKGADRRFLHTPHVRAVGLDELEHREVLP